MIEFLRIYGKWIDKASNTLKLKSNTPKHIKDLFIKAKEEYNQFREKGIFVD